MNAQTHNNDIMTLDKQQMEMRSGGKFGCFMAGVGAGATLLTACMMCMSAKPDDARSKKTKPANNAA